MSIKYINYKKKYLEIKGGSFFNFFCSPDFCSSDSCSNEQEKVCENSTQYITPQNITYQELIPQDNVCENSTSQNIPPQEPIPQELIPQEPIPQEPIPQEPNPQDNVCDNSTPHEPTPQEPIHQEYIKLNTVNKHNGKVFALSDIHGDLHSLIISLRDCAKVIGKHGYNNGENNEVVDPEIELNLLIDICTEDNDFDETFGYEWIGGNSYIVICGDIIDPKRSEIDPPTNSNYCIKDDHISSSCNKIPCLNYPQIEIKILRFINAMNERAFINGGRIIKLLGNHEIESIKENNNNFIDKYSFTNSGREYYRGKTRYEIFNFGNEGFKLLLKYDCKILIIINNTIFVHGQIPKIYKLKDIIKDNQIINNTLLYNIGDEDYDKYKDAWNIIILKYNNSNSPLQLRNWASYDNYNSRIQTGILQAIFCNQEVITTLENFLEKKGNIINKMRVVIGHCVQSDFTIKSKQIPTTTFTHLKDNDRASKTYSIDDIYFGKSDINDQNKIFGITMQCPKMDKRNKVTDFFIYHIDVGSSRGFDKHNHLISDIPDENKYLFSRNPQILSIDTNLTTGDAEVLIIKSKMKNTRIHLPRPSYEDLIESDSDKRSKLNFTVSPSNYDKKYVHFKNKYINLKNLYGGSIYELLLEYKIDDINNIDLIKIIKLCKNYFKIEDIQSFIIGCNRIKDKLDLFDGQINVIAPGDSPAKIIKYFKRLNLCPRCRFISIPLTGMNYETDITRAFRDHRVIEYIKDFLPRTNLLNTVIIDYIETGSAIRAIANAFWNLSLSVEEQTNRITLIRRIFYSLRQNTYIFNTSIDLSRRIKDKIFKPNLLNIRNYFDGNIEYLRDAERTNNRCMEKYKPWEPNDIYTYTSYELLGCDIFVYITILYTLYKTKIEIILSNIDLSDEEINNIIEKNEEIICDN